jgi:hypothetical protein
VTRARRSPMPGLPLLLVLGALLTWLIVVAPQTRADNNPPCLGAAATIVGDKDANPGDGKITGTDGNDIIVGTEGNDTIDGGGGDDRICGQGGDDTITGGAASTGSTAARARTPAMPSGRSTARRRRTQIRRNTHSG